MQHVVRNVFFIFILTFSHKISIHKLRTLKIAIRDDFNKWNNTNGHWNPQALAVYSWYLMKEHVHWIFKRKINFRLSCFAGIDPEREGCTYILRIIFQYTVFLYISLEILCDKRFVSTIKVQQKYKIIP